MTPKLTYEELEKKTSLIIDYTYSWEYLIGPDSKLSYVSPSCKNHTGYTQQEFMVNEELFSNIIHPDDKELVSRHIHHKKNVTAVESLEFRIVDRGGRTRWISHTCRPVYDENGDFLGRRASNWDITDQKQAEKERDESNRKLQETSSFLNTVLNAIPDVIGVTKAKNNEEERKRLEQQLLQAQKLEAIGTLSGGIAHDFNNLLMGIQGRASLMEMDLESNHPCREHVEVIMECSRNATELTSQLLGVARGGKYETKPISINDVVMSSSTMFGRTKKEISIHTKLQDPPPVVVADRRQIEQVFLNIYINAWQAMHRGGELYLETTVVTLDETFCKPYSIDPDRYVRISATDTGTGMDKETLKRVFDPFFTTKKRGRGTGLGLASAYGIVKNHFGTITVYSEIGKGTTFNVYLPVSDQKVQEEPTLDQKLIIGSETILLVDDESIVINVCKEMVEKLGYDVITAKSGKLAVDMFREKSEDIDLIILDMIMPGMDGDQTFDRLREINSSIPILLSSGCSLNGQAKKIMEKGCNGFIQKPFLIAQLSEKIQNILDEN